ncbi:MAG: glutathione S-transferase [Pseudomonadota bacterium]|nr:glutathione S-transferase [Pseudomonadota bacterium]
MRHQLYTFRRCPYAIRARVALYLSQIEYDAIEVDLKHKPKSLLDISPKGTVPVLVTDSGSVIDESLYIVEYALSKKLPKGFENVSTAQYDLGESMLKDLTLKFIPALNRLKYFDRYENITIEDQKKVLVECLGKWEKGFIGQGLISHAYCYYDIAMMPLIRQLAKAEPQIIHDFPKIQHWLDTWLSSDCMSAVMAKSPDNSR